MDVGKIRNTQQRRSFGATQMTLTQPPAEAFKGSRTAGPGLQQKGGGGGEKEGEEGGRGEGGRRREGRRDPQTLWWNKNQTHEKGNKALVQDAGGQERLLHIFISQNLGPDMLTVLNIYACLYQC